MSSEDGAECYGYCLPPREENGCLFVLLSGSVKPPLIERSSVCCTRAAFCMKHEQVIPILLAAGCSTLAFIAARTLTWNFLQKPSEQHLSANSTQNVSGQHLPTCNKVDSAAAAPHLETLHCGRVSELWVHPIKGVNGHQVSSALLVSTGLRFDREWAVLASVDNDGADDAAAGHRYEVLSKNKAPRLGTATAFVDEVHDALIVTATGRPRLTIPLHRKPTAEFNDEQEKRRELPVTLFGMEGLAFDEGEEAADWFSALLGRAVVLARIAPTHTRRPAQSTSHKGTNASTDAIGFHDYATLHCICDAGVTWLAKNVSDGSPVTTEQFRANIVVSGVPFPEEDVWKRVRIGNIDLRVAKQSGRCVIPTTDASGNRNPNFEPTATLRRLRACYHRHQNLREDKKLCFMFGLDLFHERSSSSSNDIIKVGDAVVPTEAQAPPQYKTRGTVC